MNTSPVRLGVDIGGTFTDVVLEQGSELHSTKVLTTYAAPEDAIIDGLLQVCEKAQVKPADITQIIHGTTLATNALIERRGAKTALITTAGFRDVIEMRTESRFEQYDLNLQLPDPLLARQHRYVVEERVSATGEVLTPIDRTKVEQLIDQIAEAGYESIAVGLLHSYVNSAHESLIREVIEKRMPSAMISLSSDVSPQMREYERFNTVVANAYIKPLIKSYLDRLAGRLEQTGVNCTIFLMHSGGGIISLQNAAEFPVRLVESGPAGGAVFAANIADRYGLDKVLSFDMGGTTAKICLIKNQTPKTSRVFEVARTYRFKKGSGMPISIPVIDMVEIGAGGGSLASVDAMNQIRVGPQSAGSEPGPACYSRGGTQPAVTDADLVLGRLDPDNFAGGSIALDSTASATALDSVIGNTLEMDSLSAAYGLAEVVDENMANAARVHAVENGEDLSEYTMIAFGGAAPLHAGRLCEKLGIDRCLVPPGAGVGSAIGFLRAPFSFEANQSVYMRLSDFDAGRVKTILSDLAAEATEFVRTCDADAPISTTFKVYMRYSGQGWEIPIELTHEQAMAPSAGTLLELFDQDYVALFGRAVEGVDVEITVWSANATTDVPDVERIASLALTSSVESEAKRQLFDPALAAVTTAAIVERDTLEPGQGVAGPAALTEDETTIIVPVSRTAIRQADGCVELSTAAE
ncbi:MAG: hydantoinase/oxoprolinase family protein [Gammaproteobacteria bacterium]|nr:hydantoinase/oxoprolinase family protein [Gammaproteobacteria bacterium]